MSTLEHESMKQHRQIRSLKDALLAEKHTANQLRDLIATLNAQLAAEKAMADQLGGQLKVAEAALSDIGDAEREDSDDLEWCERRAAKAIPSTRAALAAYRKARGL